MYKLRLENISKKYSKKDNYIIKDFSLNIKEREFLVLLGPSGCGKTTILRMIAGIEEISEGSLYIDKNRVNDVAPKNRGISMVFQNYALFPHLNVEDNISFGLKIKKIPKDEIKKRVLSVAEKLDLLNHLKKMPDQLSGGQRQRIALARAIIKNVDILLMDEPLSNLDAKLRLKARKEIVNIYQRTNATIIYVTHDQLEAMTMATKIIVLKKGIIQQVGSPKEIYNKPKNKFVAEFIGDPPMNFLNCEIKNSQLFIEGIENYHCSIDYIKDGKYTMGIRAEDILIKNEGNLKFKIGFLELVGSYYNVYGSIDKYNLILKINKENDLKKDSTIFIDFPINNIHLFSEDGSRVEKTS